MATYRIETAIAEIEAKNPEAAAVEFFRQIVEQGIVRGVVVEDEIGTRSYFEYDITARLIGTTLTQAYGFNVKE